LSGNSGAYPRLKGAWLVDWGRSRTGSLRTAARLGGPNGADSSVQGNNLGSDVADRAVGHGGRAASNGVSLGGVYSAGGHDGSLSRYRPRRLSNRAHRSVERNSLGRNVADGAVGHGWRALGDGADRGGEDSAGSH
jgi:hypothetical protein